MANIWDLPGASPTQPNPWNGGGGGQSLYYNGGNYGQSQDWWNTPIGQTTREQDNSLAYSAYGSRLGVPNNQNTFSRWFYQQQPRFNEARGLAAMNNPMMTIDQFIATLPNYRQLRNEFEAQSPAARGAQYSLYGPAVRWIPR